MEIAEAPPAPPLRQNFFFRASEHFSHLLGLYNLTEVIDWQSMTTLCDASDDLKKRLEPLRFPDATEVQKKIVIFPCQNLMKQHKLGTGDDDVQPGEQHLLLHGTQSNSILGMLSAGGVAVRGPRGKTVRGTMRYGVFAASRFETSAWYCTLEKDFMYMVMFEANRSIRYGKANKKSKTPAPNHILRENWIQIHSICLMCRTLRPETNCSRPLEEEPVLYHPIPPQLKWATWSQISKDEYEKYRRR